MQHTKTPWRISAGIGFGKGAVVADEPVPEIGGSDAVDYYGGHLIAESIAPRNAEFIVRACNAHDELVGALTDLVAATGWKTMTEADLLEAEREGSSTATALLRARAALAAAGAA